MTAHVAEASEGSGRVLFWLDSGPSADRDALLATVQLAAAYGSEIETVDMTPLPPWRFDGLPTGRVAASTSMGKLGIEGHRGHTHLVRRLRRTISGITERYGVPLRHSTVSGDPIDQLSEMCRQRGPWNIIAMSRAPSSDLSSVVSSVFANVSGATGVIVGGRRVRPWRGRVAVIAEDSERLPSMLRAAQRIASVDGSVTILIAAANVEDHDELEAQARLITEAHDGIRFESSEPVLGADNLMDTKLRDLRASMIIARFGGSLLGSPTALARALAVSSAPFLLVR